MLAVSSLATYGILLAGSPEINIKHMLLSIFTYFNIKCLHLFFLIFRCIIFYYWLFSLFIIHRDLGLIKEIFLYSGRSNINIISYKVRVSYIKVKNIQIRGFHTTNCLKSKNKLDISESDAKKSLHLSYINELYKNRSSAVIPFDRKSILAICSNFLDKNIRYKFLKEWGSKGGIYIIEYKHDPLIYYIGRTTLFKRRFNNHLKAESGNKLHTFLKLVGWEHFNISILEVCSLDTLGARENYYLQKYLPLLNSVFSSSITEVEINNTLNSKLNALRSTESKSITNTIKNKIPIYVYNIHDKSIDRSFVRFDSIKQASLALNINVASISQYRDTSVSYRGKLFYTNPIVNFDEVFESSKKNTPSGLLNKVIATKVWAYDAKTLKPVIGSPFISKRKAAISLGISKRVVDYFLDKGKPEGVKGTYIYSRPLNNKEIKILLQDSENLQLGNKIKVWVYNAKTFKLINNSPFPSLVDAANYFNINYRTVTRHLDTKFPTMQNKTLVYFFKKEIDSKLIAELSKGKIARYTRSEIWAYKVDDNGELTLELNVKP